MLQRAVKVAPQQNISIQMFSTVEEQNKMSLGVISIFRKQVVAATLATTLHFYKHTPQDQAAFVYLLRGNLPHCHLGDDWDVGGRDWGLVHGQVQFQVQVLGQDQALVEQSFPSR